MGVRTGLIGPRGTDAYIYSPSYMTEWLSSWHTDVLCRATDVMYVYIRVHCIVYTHVRRYIWYIRVCRRDVSLLILRPIRHRAVVTWSVSILTTHINIRRMQWNNYGLQLYKGRVGATCLYHEIWLKFVKILAKICLNFQGFFGLGWYLAVDSSTPNITSNIKYQNNTKNKRISKQQLGPMASNLVVKFELGGW